MPKKRYVYNFHCDCGEDVDLPTLPQAKREAAGHVGHEDDALQIEKILENAQEFHDEDFATGIYWRSKDGKNWTKET